MKCEVSPLCTLLAAASPAAEQRLRAALPAGLCGPVLTAVDAEAALQLARHGTLEMALVAEPVPGADGSALASRLAEQPGLCVLLLTNGTPADNTLTARGILTLPESAPDSLLTQAVRLLAAARCRLRRIESENARLEEKVGDIRLVNRAKLLLVQHLKMTEAEAHKYIEKQAMDTCMKRRTIAENIIRTYED